MFAASTVKRIPALYDRFGYGKLGELLPAPLFEVVTPPSGEQMRELLGDASQEFALAIVDVFDGFFSALTKISEAARRG